MSNDQDRLLAATKRLEQTAVAYNAALYDVLAITIERSSEMAASAVLQFIGIQNQHSAMLEAVIENQADTRTILRDINARLNALERSE